MGEIALRVSAVVLLHRSGTSEPQAAASDALDFVHDAVACWRTILVLSVVDAYTRECLGLEVDTSFCQPESDAGAGADRE